MSKEELKRDVNCDEYTRMKIEQLIAFQQIQDKHLRKVKNMPLLPMTDRKMGRPRQKLVENLARKIQICTPLFEFAEQDALPIQADGKTYI